MVEPGEADSGLEHLLCGAVGGVNDSQQRRDDRGQASRGGRDG